MKSQPKKIKFTRCPSCPKCPYRLGTVRATLAVAPPSPPPPASVVEPVETPDFPPPNTVIADSIRNPQNQSPDLSDWLDNQQVMQALHISPRTLHTLRTNGTLPYSRIGNKFYHNKQDIQKILANSYTMHKIHYYANK